MGKLAGLFIIAATLTLSACGFSPVHAPNSLGGASYDYKDISVTASENEKEDFLLKQALRTRMGDTKGGKYILHVDPKTRRLGLGIGAEDVGSRYDLVMDVKFELQDAKSGDIIYKDKISAVSTFGAPRDAYGTIAAENNAQEQVSAEAADRILIRLARHFAHNKAP